MAENWRQGSILEQYKHMLETGHLSDCKFLVGHEPDTKEFRVHKMILSCSSEVFEAMLYGALREKDVVRVRDITPEAFHALLYHVYCDTLEISDVEMSLSVCIAAHKYNLQTLVSKCTNYITEHLTPDNVWRILDFSDFTYNTKLKHHCNKMLQSRTEEVLSADSWCDVQESSIVTLLQQDTLNVQSELSLLSACQRWSQHQLDVNNQPEDCEASASKRVKCEPDVNNPESQVKLREIIAPLLPHIRILSLTPQQFLQFTEVYPIFSKLEQLSILQCLTEPQKYKMQDGMCEISTAREKKIERNKTVFDNIVDEMKNRLAAQQIVEAYFNGSNYFDFKPVSTVPITMNKHIVVYGFSYKTLKLAEQNRLTQISWGNTKEYDENFTVQFINETDKCVVAEYKFEGMLKYDTGMKVDLPRPFLAEKSISHSFKIMFHHQHTDRKYQFFFKTKDLSYKKNDANFDIPYNNKHVYHTFPCISKLFYKLV